MKSLIFIPKDEEEVVYDLSEVVNIICDYAENILSEPDIRDNSLKPLEMVTMLSFTNGETEIYRTMGSEMYFE